jgi:hypothetical protein
MIMRICMRWMKWFAGFALAFMAGTLPACGTMGGGGMKYLVDPPGYTTDMA